MNGMAHTSAHQRKDDANEENHNHMRPKLPSKYVRAYVSNSSRFFVTRIATSMHMSKWLGLCIHRRITFIRRMIREACSIHEQA